jgi:HlyD family secretion protein
MRIFKWLLFFTSLVIIGFFVFKAWTKTPKNPDTTILVKKGKILAITRGRGEVMPDKTYKITSPISGIVESCLKDKGDYCERGDLLLSIDTAESLAKLNGAEKEILQCQNRFAELKDEIEILRCEKEIKESRLSCDEAKREYEANRELYELKGVAKEALLNAASQLEKANLSLILKEDELSSLKRKRENEFNLVLLQAKEAQASYDSIKKQISWAEVKSPISGIIMEKNPDIVQGFALTQGTHLFTITSLSYQVKGLIDELEIGKVNIGQKATIRLDAHPYQPFSAVIQKISPEPIVPEGKIGIRSFEVYLDINPPFKVTPKMQCSLELKKVISSVLKVNLEDVEEENAKRYVYLMKGSKKIKRQIKTGFENETEAEVLSGLKEGDKIIKSPSFEIEK